MRPLEMIADRPETRVDDLTRRLSGQVGQWLVHHPSEVSAVDLAKEKSQIQQLIPSNLGSWGTLRVLDQLEAQGDHQFDLLYQQISARYDHWAVRHPVQARRSGVTAAPVQAVSSAGTAGPASSSIGSGVGAISTPPVHGVTPDGGPPPPNFSEDTYVPGEDCGCDDSLDKLVPPASGPQGAYR